MNDNKNPTAAQSLDLDTDTLWYIHGVVKNSGTIELAHKIADAIAGRAALIAQARAAQPESTTGTTGAIELPALPKTCHVVRNGLGGIAFEAYAPEEMEAYARAAIAADRAKCQVSHTAEMAQWARDNNLNVPPHWEAQPASAQPDRGAAVAPSDAKGKADDANAGELLAALREFVDNSQEHDVGGGDVVIATCESRERAAALLEKYRDKSLGVCSTKPSECPDSSRCGCSQSPATSAADAKDAARYRFMAGVDVPSHSSRWQRWNIEYWQGYHGGWTPLVGTDLDEAIDAQIAAMAAAPSSAAGKEGGAS